MNTSPLLRAVAVVGAIGLAALTTSCSGESESGSPPSTDRTGTASQDPVRDLLEFLATTQTSENKRERDHISLVPSESLAGLKEEFEKRDFYFLNMNDFKNDHYFVNQIILKVRKEGASWLIYDLRKPELTVLFQDYVFTDHRIAEDKSFGHIACKKITNEIQEERSADRISFERVFGAPWLVTDLQFQPGTLFVATKNGGVHWVSLEDSSTRGKTLMLPSPKDGKPGLFRNGESGLVGITFHPQFADNRRFFTHYCWDNADGTREARLSEWTVGEDLVATDEKILLSFPQTQDTHNAGQLVFGPRDGLLYIAVGDGSEGDYKTGRAPSHTMRGKVHRIDVDHPAEGKLYSIPESNPFVGDDKFPPETWAWGFRNPWRIAFAPDGRLIAGDTGEHISEEITFVHRGRHHGWPFIEGTHTRSEWPYGDLVPAGPLIEYSRKSGMSAVGGHVYEGEAVPWLKGKYVYADYMSGRIWAIDLPPVDDFTPVLEADAQLLGRWNQLFTTFGKDENGELFVADVNGVVSKMLDAGVAPPENGGNAGGTIQFEDTAIRGMFGAEPPQTPRESIAQAEIDLGRKLYEDRRISNHGKSSCATCHALDAFGQDNQVKAPGGQRNTPSTFNADRQFAQFWDYRTTSVETLAGHGLADEKRLVSKLKAIPEYVDAFGTVYGGGQAAISAANLGKALGAFVRQLTTRSRWDDYLDGNDDALTAGEREGLNMFIGVGCATCHQYRLLGGSMPQKLGLIKPVPGEDTGHFKISKNEGHMYFFKVPPLTNVANTAPYYHDGSIATLEEAVRHMADVQLMRQLTDAQVASITTFLKALTGEKPDVLK